jgi:C-terminal processing protease CtpA/Prc
VDLRFNGGGGEDLAQRMAGRIVDEERTYSLNCYRAGPGRGDLGPRLERRCAPRGPWRWRSPVFVLTGQKTFSSAESFALMLAVCPHVTSLGDRTGGSSANPERREFGGGIVVNVPRWNDMAPDGTPVEDRGVAPEVPVKGGLADFAERDPVLEEALARLRRIPAGKRLPGRRKE